MYAVLQAHITLGSFEFTQVHSVKITKSLDELSDSAVIEMPTSFILGNKDESFTRKSLKDEIKEGDEVVIRLGYKDIYDGEEFRGYIKSIKPTVPLQIECEDKIYLIRKKDCNKNFHQTNLKAVLQYIVDGTGVELNAQIPDVQMDKFLLKNVNGAKALEQLKEDFGLTIYIDDDGKLFAGLRQQLGQGTPIEFHRQKNVIKDSLKFRSADSVKLKIKAIGIRKDNTKVEVEAGDTDGEVRTYHFYNISDAKELLKVANEKLEKQKYSGFEGHITGFLVPAIKRGEAAKYQDNKYESVEGTYLAEKVTLSFDDNGVRRNTYFGNKLSV